MSKWLDAGNSFSSSLYQLQSDVNADIDSRFSTNPVWQDKKKLIQQLLKNLFHFSSHKIYEQIVFFYIGAKQIYKVLHFLFFLI